MRKLNFGILVILSALGLFSGCQKDDICPGATETTPLLNIEFYNAETPDALKIVQNLMIIALESTDTLLGPTSTTEVSIPLKTNQSFTEYRFITNSGTEDENEDVVRFDYNPSPDYINRACGFKVNFLDLTLRRDMGEDSWIQSDDVLIETIENEDTLHVTFTH